jgi:hypothetical protein
MTVINIGSYWKMNKRFFVKTKKNMIELKLCMDGHWILPSKAFYSSVFSDVYLLYGSEIQDGHHRRTFNNEPNEKMNTGVIYFYNNLVLYNRMAKWTETW